MILKSYWLEKYNRLWRRIIHSLDSKVIHVKQKQDITYKNLALQSCLGKKNTSNTEVISADDIL